MLGSAFRVTGTALDFGDNISVVVTGSTAYVGSALTEAALDIGAKVYNSTGIAIPNNAWTELTFDSEKYDTDNIHSITTNTSRLTCQTSGKYLIVGNAQFDNDATGIRGYRILLNGTTILAEIQEDGMGFNVATISIIHDLNVNDYVELEVYHQVGSLDIIAFDDYSPYFMMQKIDGISANRIPIYDDSVIQTTGTSLSFDENLDVSVTGTTAYISAKHPTGTAGYVPQFVSAGDSVEDSTIFGTSTGISVNDNFKFASDNANLYVANEYSGGIIYFPVHDTVAASKNVLSLYATSAVRMGLFGDNTLQADFRIRGAAGNMSYLSLTADGPLRWRVARYNEAEGGSNAGSDFHIFRYTDAGAYLGDPFKITRSSGDVILANDLRIGQGLYVGSTATDPPNDTIVVDGDIYTDEWQSFTGSSTISGWSSLATSRLLYKKLGNLVYVQYQLEGISNSTGTSFTVPYTQQSNIPLRVIQRGMNAGSQLDYCYASFPSSSTLVTFYPTKSASSWTASGEKRIEGEFWYEAQ
jgi:hypothetical protein